MKCEIIIVTAAYGHQKVNSLGGQQALLPMIAAAGADGVEIRRELLDEQARKQLPMLAAALADYQLTTFYSAPDALFLPDGSLNPQLAICLQEAEQLHAQLLKMPLGHYRPGSSDSVALKQLLAASPVHLVVENDQTECGTLAAMSTFFQGDESRTSGGMTFDMANWLWVGEDARTAAQHLGRYVSYIHVKAATPHQDSWRAIALDEADDQWRELLALLPNDVPRGIEFPLEGEDLEAVTRHYVNLLRKF